MRADITSPIIGRCNATAARDGDWSFVDRASGGMIKTPTIWRGFGSSCRACRINPQPQPHPPLPSRTNYQQSLLSGSLEQTTR
mmetsp:Transcript_39406/g.39934  ORF Transcript_39406/g.39934 Transcript_39406/m.39934 type:complete len:83 (+) Transcript_39406:209-457(+)